MNIKDLLHGVVGAGVTTAGGVASSIINYRSQQETNRANLDLARQQNDWNIQQWNRENEYNSPANQIRLLEEAGLNPNNYDQGSATASSINSADLANQQAPQHDLNTPFQSGMNVLQQAAQAAELRAQIAEAKQRMRFADSYFPHSLEALRLANEQTLAQTGLIDQNTRNAWLDYRNLWRMMTPNYEYQKLINEGQRKTNRNLDLVPGQVAQEIASSQQGIKESQQRITASQAEIEQAWKQLQISERLTNQQIKNLQMDAWKLSLDGNVVQWKLNMMHKYHIDPDSQPVNNLINLLLADPENFSNIGHTLKDNFEFLFDSSRAAFGSPSWSNPFKGWKPRLGSGRTF